ncbi:hypothetical protein MX111_09110 [Streptococcus uberis]|uniref:hypothetical protein n=1 Tax=Streptococcus uberis TaxID=1349 RepID=UPI0027DD9141|nr:hypothetical protein [Streptococcus uberis]MCK1239561.1 hypothetical protein [Streptococcus uberis]
MKIEEKEFLNNLKVARSRKVLVDRITNEVLTSFDFSLRNIEFGTSNLEDAISCYVMYGELPESGSISDFWKAISDFKRGSK